MVQPAIFRHFLILGFIHIIFFQVRSTDYTWKEAKKSLKKDSRWESAGALEREEKEKLFNSHVENLTKRKREKFRYFKLY